MQMRYDLMYEGPQLEGQKYDAPMLPHIPIELINATAEARFDCDWEKVFKTQVTKTTKATGA
jgi:hypothetical protein